MVTKSKITKEEVPTEAQTPESLVKEEPTIEAAKPIVARARLSGGRPLGVVWNGPLPCSVEIPKEVMMEAEFWPTNLIEITAKPGEIVLRLVKEAPKPQEPQRRMWWKEQNFDPMVDVNEEAGRVPGEQQEVAPAWLERVPFALIKM